MRLYRAAAIAALCLVVASAASARTLDHMLCYKGASEAYNGLGIAHLNDDTNPNAPGGAHTFFVKKTKDYCVSSTVSADQTKNAEVITDPAETLFFENPVLDANDRWEFYAAKRASGNCTLTTTLTCGDDDDCLPAITNGTCNVYTKFDKSLDRNVSRRVLDKVLDTRLSFAKEIGILAPMELGSSAPLAGTEDYFKCYGVKATKASCVGGSNDGKFCKVGEDAIYCPSSGVCTLNRKFPKEIYPDGFLGVVADDAFTLADNFEQVKKLKMVCQSASKNGETSLHPGTAMMCYSVAQYTGTPFVEQNSPLSSNVFETNGTYLMKKPELLCNPACVDPPALTDLTFNNLILKVTSLQIGANENVGEALDVDGDTTRDNALYPLAFIANPELNNAVNDGDLMLLFSLDGLTDGAHIVSGYTADLATPAGCGGIGDINNGTQMCNYEVNQSSLEVDDTCNIAAEIQIPVTINTGAGTAIGGGPGTTFSISFAIGEGELTVRAQDVKVDATFTQIAGPDVDSIQGVIGGAVPLTDFQEALQNIDGECSVTTTTACNEQSDCPGGESCYLFGMITPEAIASIIESSINPDIDLDGIKNCIKGNNQGELCVNLSDCPDSDTGTVENPRYVACQDEEAISLGLKFTGIDANIVGVQD